MHSPVARSIPAVQTFGFPALNLVRSVMMMDRFMLEHSCFAFDDADYVEGLEFIEGEAEGVGAVMEGLEEFLQAGEAVFHREGADGEFTVLLLLSRQWRRGKSICRHPGSA